MKKISLIALIAIILSSCNPKQKQGSVLVTPITDTTKVIDTTIFEDEIASVDPQSRSVKKQKKEKVYCSFGFKKFNDRKRPIEEAPGGVKGKKPKPTQPPTQPPVEPPTTATGGTIYLNFYGKEVSGTMWNTSGAFTVNDAGFSQPEIDQTVTQVKAHYADYNVTITTDESVFNAEQADRRVEIIITETYQWFGQAGGVAYIGSFTWSDNTPAFVFSLLLNYNVHNVAEAAAHEAGHTLGLRHQSDCSDGVVTNQYSAGKTMGVSYYVPIGLWVTGTSSMSCSEQNDREMLAAAVGVK